MTTCSLLVVNCTSRISRSLMAETFSRASLLAALAGLPVMSRLVTSPPSPTPPPSPPDSPIPHTGRLALLPLPFSLPRPTTSSAVGRPTVIGQSRIKPVPLLLQLQYGLLPATVSAPHFLTHPVGFSPGRTTACLPALPPTGSALPVTGVRRITLL